MSFSKAATDPDIFPDPLTFDPDRWLQDEETVAEMKRYSQPFGKGARMCLGLQ